MFDKLFNRDTFLNRFFKKVDNVVWDLSTGKIGILDERQGGIITMTGEGKFASINLNPIDQFGMPLPAFAQNTPASEVKIGDLMWGDTKSTRGWVTEIETNEGASEAEKAYRFELIDMEGGVRRNTIKKIQMFGLDAGGAMIVRTLGSMTGGAAGLEGLNGMLMPMLAMGGDLSDIGDMLPFMFMGNMGGTAGANPMASMFGGSGAGGFMQTMMQYQMLKKFMGDDKKPSLGMNARRDAIRPGRNGGSIFDERP